MMNLADIVFEWIDEDPELKALKVTRNQTGHKRYQGPPFIAGPHTMGTIYDDHVMVTSFGAIWADKGNAMARFRLDAADPDFFEKLKAAMMNQG